MGYSTRYGSQIKDFWPDNTDTTLYLSGDITLEDMIAEITSKWPDIRLGNFDQVTISTEHIHTSCLGYDRYDPSDYTTFVVVTRIE